MTDFEKEILEYIRFRRCSLHRADLFSVFLSVLFGVAVAVVVIELVFDHFV